MIIDDPHQAPDHDPEECYECLLKEEVISTCRCAECCRRLLIEVSVEDAEREPRIKDRGSPTYTPAELTESGEDEFRCTVSYSTRKSWSIYENQAAEGVRSHNDHGAARAVGRWDPIILAARERHR
jgi:hypothetical protein